MVGQWLHTSVGPGIRVRDSNSRPGTSLSPIQPPRQFEAGRPESEQPGLQAAVRQILAWIGSRIRIIMNRGPPTHRPPGRPTPA